MGLTQEQLDAARQSHWTLPKIVIDEAVWLFPTDLPARIEWLRERAYASVSEEDRHLILTHVQRVRQGRL